jgi:hypothetical protein
VVYISIEKSIRENPPEGNIIYLKLAPSLDDYVSLVNARFDKETRENPMIISEDNDEYIIAMDDIMAEAMRKIIRAEIPMDFLLASIADFMAILPLRLTGEEEILRAKIRQIEKRIDDWKAGLFPSDIV